MTNMIKVNNAYGHLESVRIENWEKVRENIDL